MTHVGLTQILTTASLWINLTCWAIAGLHNLSSADTNWSTSLWSSGCPLLRKMDLASWFRMSSGNRFVLKRALLAISAISIVLLYGIQYGGIRILPGRVYFDTSEKNSSDTEVYMNEFLKRSCETSREKCNWRSIIHPCSGLLSWEKRNHSSKSLESDPYESFVSGKDIRPAGEYSRVYITTKSRKGSMKTEGGDHWRVKINGTASLNAHVADYGNGTYGVTFLCMDQGVYFVHIYLDYSLCNGLRDPPSGWFRKGKEMSYCLSQCTIASSIHPSVCLLE